MSHVVIARAIPSLPLLLTLCGAVAFAQEPGDEPLPEGGIARMGLLRFRPAPMGSILGLSPDGKMLITRREGIVVWDSETGRRLQSFPKAYATVAEVTADGKRIFLLEYTADRRVALKMYRMADGKPLATIRDNVTGFSLAPDQRTLVVESAGSARFIPGGQVLYRSERELRDLADNRVLHRLPPEDIVGERSWFRFSPDSKTLYVITPADLGDKSTVRRFDVATGKLRSQMTINRIPRFGPFVSDGKMRIAAGNAIWDLEKGLHWSTKKDLHTIYGFMPDGKQVIGVRTQWGEHKANDASAPLFLWDLKADQAGQQFLPMHDPNFVVLRDGKSCISAASYFALRRWDIATGKTLAPVDTPVEPAGSFAFSRNRKYLATIDQRGQPGDLHIWECASGKRVCHVPLSAMGLAYAPAELLLSFTPDGKTVLCGDTNRVFAIDRATGKRTAYILGVPHVVGPTYTIKSAFALSPDGATIAATVVASVRGHGAVQLWDWKNSKRLATLDGGDKEVKHAGPIAFSSDGKLLVCTIYPQRNEPPLPPRIQIWSVPERKLIREWEAPRAFAEIVARFGMPHPLDLRFCEDDEFVVGSWYNAVHVWTTTGKEIHHFEPPQKTRDYPTHLAVPPVSNGKLAATIHSGDDCVRLWDLATGKQVGQCRGHAEAQAVAFSPDGSLLVTSGTDTTVLLTDVRKLLTKRQ